MSDEGLTDLQKTALEVLTNIQLAASFLYAASVAARPADPVAADELLRISRTVQGWLDKGRVKAAVG